MYTFELQLSKSSEPSSCQIKPTIAISTGLTFNPTPAQLKINEQGEQAVRTKHNFLQLAINLILAAAMTAVNGSLSGPVTIIVSSRAVLTQPDDSLVLSPATISISPITGKIISIVPEVIPQDQFPAATTYIDHSPKVLMPGLVDAHVHLNEPGRTEWEGFWTGTRAAASGGVTTVVDMPLNAIPPTTTLNGFREKLEASKGQLWVDVGFYGGVIPGNENELQPLVEAGVRGFKCFLIDSGVSQKTFDHSRCRS